MVWFFIGMLVGVANGFFLCVAALAYIARNRVQEQVKQEQGFKPRTLIVIDGGRHD